MPEPRIAKSIRLAPETWAAIAKLAAKERRSVNNWIESTVETTIDVQDGWEP